MDTEIREKRRVGRKMEIFREEVEDKNEASNNDR